MKQLAKKFHSSLARGAFGSSQNSSSRPFLGGRVDGGGVRKPSGTENNASEPAVLPTEKFIRQELKHNFLFRRSKENYHLLVRAMHGKPMNDTPIAVNSVLAHPQMFNQIMRQEFLRHGLYLEDGDHKKVLQATAKNGAMWQVVRYQRQMVALYNEMRIDLRNKIKNFKGIYRYSPRLSGYYARWIMQLNNLNFILSRMETQKLEYNMHPDSDSKRKLRGVSMRISGARRSNKKSVHHVTIGSCSNTDNLINRVVAKTQVPTNNFGVYGLTSRFYYGVTKDMQISKDLVLKDDFMARPFHMPSEGVVRRRSNKTVKMPKLQREISYFKDE